MQFSPLLKYTAPIPWSKGKKTNIHLYILIGTLLFIHCFVLFPLDACYACNTQSVMLHIKGHHQCNKQANLIPGKHTAWMNPLALLFSFPSVFHRNTCYSITAKRATSMTRKHKTVLIHWAKLLEYIVTCNGVNITSL